MTTVSSLSPGSVCVVTGASSGIGFAIAQSLLARDLRVVCIARGRERLEQLFEAQADRALVRALDVTDAAAVSGLLGALPEDWREVEVVVANAGSDVGGRQPFVDGQIADWASTVETNVTGVMRICHAVLAGMVARERGHVVTVGSTAGLMPYAGGAAYAASKHAVRAFTDALRLEYRKSPIRITEVLPGLVRTGFAEARFRGDAGRAAAFYDAFPAALKAADVAAAVLFAIEQPPHVNVSQIVVTPTGNK